MIQKNLLERLFVGSCSLPIGQNECQLFENYYQKWFQSCTVFPPILKKAIGYSTLQGGKRFRPLLVAASGHLMQISFEELLPIALTVEIFHAASLVHDDLPGMDNSEMRRHQPSCWKSYGEGLAILAGDGLIIESIRILSQAPYPVEVCLHLVQEMTQLIGFEGIIGGQGLDLIQDFSDPENLAYRKTGCLLEFCLVAPALIAEKKDWVSPLRTIAHNLSLLFQFRDDCLDQSLSEITGKSCQKDGEKFNLVHSWKDQILERITTLKKQIAQLLPQNESADLLRELVRWAEHRVL
jgi:geranylgeranyl diphosphate synthase type II